MEQLALDYRPQNREKMNLENSDFQILVNFAFKEQIPDKRSGVEQLYLCHHIFYLGKSAISSQYKKLVELKSGLR